jgi:hypothetical protein
MAEDRLAELAAIINALIARTREGKVEWEWSVADRRSVADLVNGRVLVGKDRDGDSVVTIQDTEAVTLEAINVGFLEYADLKSSADELYELARRSALQVDSKLESILQEIAN